MLKRIPCTLHANGIFTITPKRGRQPTKCTPTNPCDRANNPSETVTAAPTAVAVGNPSLDVAKAAKEQLTALGWICKGSAKGTIAEMTCSRGAETLTLTWENGAVTSQLYTLEFKQHSKNNYPPSKLHFNPDEMTDSELVRLLKGMNVVWYNTIARSEETGAVGNKVTIEHIFFDNGDEDTSKRIVKFVDRNTSHFRAFHASAILKVT